MANQKLTNAPKVTMDARKFLASVNKGYGGQIKLVESKLSKLGEALDKTLRLVSHNHNSVMFEDTGANVYYKADIKRNNNRTIQIDNIQELSLVDQEKPEIFKSACGDLINAIEESVSEGNGDEAANKILNRILSGHCSPYAVPYSGVASTRDGGSHSISLSSSGISENVMPEVVRCLKEAVKSSSVTINEGVITIGEESAKLPISELTRKQVVARKMKEIAENAYKSGNFRRLIKNVAAHISNHEMKEAIKLSKDFFSEEQEFCLLDKRGMVTLVENSMYSQGVWNYHVIKNTSMLLWETNCHINKSDILEQWNTAASKTGVNALVENVDILRDAASKSPKVFSDTYDKFLGHVFTEDYSSRSVKAQSYLNMLKILNNVVDGSDADSAVKYAVNDLIFRLESDINNVDDATLYEVEELLANVGADLVHDTDTLSNFDTIPEPASVDSFGSEEDMVGDFEGDMSEPDFGVGEPGMGADLGDTDESDLDTDMSSEAEASEEFEEEDELQLAHVVRNAKPIAEMTADDVKVVLEALKGIKPEQVEVDDEEFKSKLKKDLTESEVSFIKQVMDHSKEVDAELFEGIAAAYYDLVISEDIPEVKENDDSYQFNGDDVNINEEYHGLDDDDDEDNDNNDEDCVEEGISAQRAKSDARDRRAGRNFGQAKGSSGGSNRGIAKAGKGSDSVEEGKDVGHKKTQEGDKDGDRDGDYDDNNLDESLAVVAQDDEKLLQIIDKVLDAGGSEEVEVDDNEKASDIVDQNDDGVQDDEGQLIVDEGEDCDANTDMSTEAEADEEETVNEDNNITEPPNAEYDSETAASKDGEGKKINSKPTFSDTDYDGTSGATTGKDKPGSGHPTSGK